MLTAETEGHASGLAENLRRCMVEIKAGVAGVPLTVRARILLHDNAVLADDGGRGLRKQLLGEYGESVVLGREAEITKILAEFEGVDSTDIGRLIEDDDEEDVLGGKGVWLSKKGEGLGLLTGSKRRYFLLVRGCASGLLKLNYYSDVRGGGPVDKKGAIELLPNASISTDGSTILIVRPLEWIEREEREKVRRQKIVCLEVIVSDM